MTTASQVKTAAQLERLRLAQQAVQARAQAGAQAQQAEAETEAQARKAISETERQAQAARSEVGREAESRQAEIRKQRGQAEREAEAAKAQAREAQRVEQRKVVLPVSKPRDLGLASYVVNVETARKQAHQAGGSAKAAVTKVRDEYFKQVDKVRDDAIADINKQKAGVITDIQKQLVGINADITKQLANLNSGVNEWEKESQAKIAKAQADYEAAIKAALNKSGTEVFADMKGKGLVPADATLTSYDKNTGQVTYSLPPPKEQQNAITSLQGAGFVKDEGNGNYTINVRNESGNLANIATIKTAFPDLDTSQIADLQAEHDGYVQMQTDPQGYFKRLQSEGIVPSYAIYKDIDTKTGQVNYEIPAWSTIGIDKIRPTDAERASLTTQFINLPIADQNNIAQAATGDSNMVVLDGKTSFGLLTSRGIFPAKGSADTKDRVLAYYKDNILSADDSTKALSDLHSNVTAAALAELKSWAIGMVPVYGTVKQWGQMSTGGRIASITMDVVFIASLAAAGIQSGFFKSIGSKIVKLPEKGAGAFREIVATGERGFVRIAKPEVTRGGYLKPITVKGAEEIGMTTGQYERFLAARVATPGLTPDTFRYLESVGRTIRPGWLKNLPGGPPATEAAWARFLKGKPITEANVKAAMEAYAKSLKGRAISPSEAAAFYRETLPSYAEIIAAGLPAPGKWSPSSRTFTVSANNAPTVSTWANLTSKVMPANLPKNVQTEIVLGSLFGLANDAATTAAALKYAQALQQGKTKAQAQSLAQKAANQTIANAVIGMAQATKGLTQQQVKAITKSMTKGATQTKVEAATKTITDASTRTRTSPQTQTKTQTHPTTKTGAGTETKLQTSTSEKGKGGNGKKIIVKPPGEGTQGKEKKEYPDGTVVWRMGKTMGDVYKIIPPPYTMLKPITSKYPPRGMTKTKGTPQQTLTFLGGKVPFNNVSFDLGVTDGFIDVKSRKIKFTGRGQKTNVGTRIESTTQGVALVHNPPITSRRGRGKPLVSHGVYSDRKGTRITRRHRRGWRRIY